MGVRLSSTLGVAMTREEKEKEARGRRQRNGRREKGVWFEEKEEGTGDMRHVK